MATDLTRVSAEHHRPEWTIRVVQPEPAPSAERALLVEMDEEQLVAACLAGQRCAFDLIVERHRRTVYRLCYRFVGNHEDASDLSQDVFVRAYKPGFPLPRALKSAVAGALVALGMDNAKLGLNVGSIITAGIKRA